ncbi:MAG: hypothetical protein WBW44_04500 [Solirubrobacterales bacterium]
MKRILLGIIFIAFFIPTAQASAVKPYEAFCLFGGCGGVSEDGERTVFAFNEDLADGPDHGVYERYQGVTRPLITFPMSSRLGVRLLDVSEDGKRVFVETGAPLTENDTDGFRTDAFLIEDGKTTLMSNDPADPATNSSKQTYQFERITEDGSAIYFIRGNVRHDLGRICIEIYARTANEMKKLPFECGQDRLEGLSEDGASVFTSGDETVNHFGPGWGFGVFRLRGDQVDVMTNFPKTSVTNCTPFLEYGDITPDGESLFFSSTSRISPLDTDDNYDAYLRHPDGEITLISEGTPNDPNATHCGSGVGDTAIALAENGQSALFATPHPLVPEDLDSSIDVYRWALGAPFRLVTTGPSDTHPEVRNPALTSFLGDMFIAGWQVDASDDLRVIAFASNQRLVAADTDDSMDVYSWIDGKTQLVSTGPTSESAEIGSKLLGVSGDGSQIAFSSAERMNGLDTDKLTDIYQRVISESGEAVVSAAKGKAMRRTRLISAESIAPRMKVSGKVKMKAARKATVLLSCPKEEKNGPCRGSIRVKSKDKAKVAGKSRFKIKSGKAKNVPLRLTRSPGQTKRKLQVTVRAADRLGNQRTTKRRAAVRRTPARFRENH